MWTGRLSCAKSDLTMPHLVFFRQHQISAVKIYFFQQQQPVKRLIDRFAAAQRKQVFAQCGGEADI